MNEVGKPQNFEERMMARIKESMGDLMSDEDLKKILEKGVEKAFFDRRNITDSYHRITKQEPSLVDEVVKQYLAENMREAVRQWIKDNPEKIQNALDEAVKLGAGGCLVSALNLWFSSHMYQMKTQMEQTIREGKF